MGSIQQQFQLSVDSGAELLQRIYPNGSLGGVVLDGLPPLGLELGAHVVVTIGLKQPAERSFRLRGQLAWIRHKAAGTLREAFGVDFSEKDTVARNRLLQFAHQELPPEASRHDDRFLIDLPVQLKIDGTARAEHFCDLSMGGAFVHSESPPEIGTMVSLRFRPPLSLTAIELEGRVAWARRGEEPRGMGLAFVYRNPSDQKRIAKLVDRLKTQRDRRA